MRHLTVHAFLDLAYWVTMGWLVVGLDLMWLIFPLSIVAYWDVEFWMKELGYERK